MNMAMPPRFGTTYEKRGESWVNVTKKDYATPNEVKEAYTTATHKQAMFLSSSDMVFWNANPETSIREIGIILTDTEAEKFHQYQDQGNNQLRFMNKLFEGFYTFKTMNIEKTDSLDFLV
ncbi:MAG: hypothetical protein K2X66_00315 [Cyanobacteria bacterium]|nr:hypothetical protein [Cyanobacteriota bacterium]